MFASRVENCRLAEYLARLVPRPDLEVSCMYLGLVSLVNHNSMGFNLAVEVSCAPNVECRLSWQS